MEVSRIRKKSMEDNKKTCIVHFLPAKSGDCFVLEFDNKQCILIDCGYSNTYKEDMVRQ